MIVKDSFPVATNEPVASPAAREAQASARFSLMAMAIGCLIEEGKISSLDVPVADYYPHWRRARSTGVTIGMLISHTTGLEDAAGEMLPLPSELESQGEPAASDPGLRFSYNASAFAVLMDIVRKASGELAHDYANARLVAPLGISTLSGDLGFSELDTMKIGALVANRGRWKGRQLVPREFMLSFASHGELTDEIGLMAMERRIGLSYFVSSHGLDSLLRAGMPLDLVEALRPLEGASFHGEIALRDALASAWGDRGFSAWRDLLSSKGKTPESIFGTAPMGQPTFAFNGFTGNLVVVRPANDTVGMLSGADVGNYFDDMEAAAFASELAERIDASTQHSSGS